MSYLFEWPEHREAESLRRLFSGAHRGYDWFWGSLGVRHPAWFGLNLPKSVSLGEFAATDRRYAGDIDWGALPPCREVGGTPVGGTAARLPMPRMPFMSSIGRHRV